MTALFVREPLVKDVKGTPGPAVNIATGIGGHRCSKRGAVTINFKVRDSCFSVINVHIKQTSFADRLRDLTKILQENSLAIDDVGTSTFLVGAFNFTSKDELNSSVADARAAGVDSSANRMSTHESCEMFGLKNNASQVM